MRYAAGQLQQPETTITYAYHRNGQLASYAYTATGQLQSETTQFGPFSKSVAYRYHDNGDLKHYTDPEGRILEYHYDANRQLEAINLPNVGLYTVNSHRWFAPEQITLPGGSVQKRSYDGFMQLTGIEVNDPGQNRQMHYQYQYDKVGNITSKATEHGAYVYQYDDLYRLVEAQNLNSATEKFTYDPVGNRLTTQASPTPWIYNANHALQSRPEAISYGYDANGSTTQITRNGQTTQLIYNAANRLAEIKNNANQTIATYRYDPFGRRISKTVHGNTTYFLYSPQGLIGEYSATGSLIRGYGYKPGGHWMTDPLYLKTGNAREQHYFYQNDHLGTPQKLMSTTGAIVWDARYEAFGHATPIPLLPGVQLIDNPLRFAGQYHDSETGWHYNWHRYYAPELGRYITSDPIGLAGGLNTYGYVGGNPVMMVDPNGLWLKCPFREPKGDRNWVPYTDSKDVSGEIFFHCGALGYKTYMENMDERKNNRCVENLSLVRTDEFLEWECVYDNHGLLVTRSHRYGGCAGTPNRYSGADLWNHFWHDVGGVWHAGGPALLESLSAPLREPFSQAWSQISSGFIIYSDPRNWFSNYYFGGYFPLYRR